MNPELARFRNETNQFMRRHPQSPLSKEQKDDFDELDYFDENRDLIILSQVEMFPADDLHIKMETSTGEMRHYRRWAKVVFEVGGVEASLIIYSDPWGESLFLPFKDTTNGSETYGAGRYLDNSRPGLTVVNDGKLQIDFNFAYNPYCAYSPAFSCPLPPHENWLKVPIQAGEKRFN